MSRLISDILGANRVEFNNLVSDWERRSGHPSNDLKLYSDIRTRAIRAIRELGLDPTDIISGELYFALQDRAKSDNSWLADILNIKPGSTPEELITAIVKWVNRNNKSSVSWTLKPSVMRGFIKKIPPKGVMKVLGLRSVDSMLKRNSVAEIMNLANELESPDYHKKFAVNYKKLKSSDFDEKKTDFEVLTKSRIAKLEKSQMNLSKIILPNYALGSVLIIPPKSRFPLDVLAITMILAEVVSDIRRYGAYYKIISVRKDFAEQFGVTVSQGLMKASSQISEIGWNSIHKHLVGNEDVVGIINQPHITGDEFDHTPAIHLLAEVDDRFNYWQDLEYVFYQTPDQPPISLNLMDVVMNKANHNHFHNQSGVYGRSRLWEELWTRYLTNDRVTEQIIDKIINP